MAQVEWDAQMQPGGQPGGQASGAQMYHGQAEAGQPGQGGVSLTSLAGAVLSLGLLAGVGVWGYELAMRDVTGVPVVRALEGPMRVQPEDPGGMAAEHLGLAVNEVAAEGGATSAADRLTLAPQVTELAPEDQPADPSANAIVEAAPLPVPNAEPEDLAAASDQAVLAALEEGDAVAAALALAEAVTEGVVPLGEAPQTEAPVAPAADPTPDPAPDVQSDRIAASIPGVKRSPRPTRRPAGLAAAAAVTIAARADANPATAPLTGAQPAVVTNEIDPASLNVGTRLVQLGAFDSPEIARAEWDKLTVRFADYMGDKARVIEQAQSGGKTFYRLRAHGFADLSDARRFCSVLMADKAACIPVVTR